MVEIRVPKTCIEGQNYDYQTEYFLSKKKSLGQGAQAKVYKAYYGEGRLCMALKIFQTENHHWMLKEASALKQLEGKPHIIQLLHDEPAAIFSRGDKEREVSLLALEYVSGSLTLDKVIKNGLSERKCWHYFKQLMEAVKSIHGSDQEFQATGYPGQAHRDLKPSNILVTPDE